MKDPLHDRAMRGLSILERATRNGNIAWEKTDTDEYVFGEGADRIRIEFKRPLMAETGSDRDAVEIAFLGGVFTFYAGTEGMMQITRMLALADPVWREHYERLIGDVSNALDDLERRFRRGAKRSKEV